MEEFCTGYYPVVPSIVWLDAAELCLRQRYVSWTEIPRSPFNHLSLCYPICHCTAWKNSKNINLFILFPPGSSMKLTSTLTENSFTFTWQLVNMAIRCWISIYFSPKHNRHADYKFLKRVLKPYSAEWQTEILNTDKHAAYGYAIARLIKEGKLRADVK